MLNNSENGKRYDILVHTKDILVVQTNAGEFLESIPNTHKDLINLQNINLQHNEQRNEKQLNRFGKFNLGLHVNDNAKEVLNNRAKLLAQINKYLSDCASKDNKVDDDSQNGDNKDDVEGVANQSASLIKSIHWLNQIHSNKVVRIGEKARTGTTFNGANQVKAVSVQLSLSLTPVSADALITQMPNTALAIMTADCVPIVLYDASSGQIAAIHAGWQGLANGIIANTCAQFKNDAIDDSVQARSVQGWIGASISQGRYEVSIDVVDKLLFGCLKMGMDIVKIKQQIVGEHDNPDKAWLDLPTLALLQLQMYNIKVNTFNKIHHTKPKPESSTDLSIESLSIESLNNSNPAYACSYTQPQYYSYRRMTHLGGKNTGRMALLIMRLR